jgi:hypothetical protein
MILKSRKKINTIILNKNQRKINRTTDCSLEKNNNILNSPLHAVVQGLFSAETSLIFRGNALG